MPQTCPCTVTKAPASHGGPALLYCKDIQGLADKRGVPGSKQKVLRFTGRPAGFRGVPAPGNRSHGLHHLLDLRIRQDGTAPEFEAFHTVCAFVKEVFNGA